MSRTLKPNSTQIPDVILDEWLPVLSGAEFQVVMFVARKTFGWGKDRDRISLSQIEAGTSLARSTISAACEGLRARGMLCIIPGNRNTANTYWLNEEWVPETIDQPSTKIELVRKSNYGSTKIVLQPSTKIEHTRNKERDTIQETKTPLPPGGGNGAKPYSAELTAFWEAYPAGGRARGSQSTTSAAWAKLTPSDRDAAGRGLTVALSNSQFVAYPPAPDRWLKQRRWETFLDGLPMDAPLPTAPARPVSAVKAGATSTAEYYTARLDGILKNSHS